MKIGYYPGCSLSSTGREYNESLQVIAPLLGVTLQEIDDWNCCGASSAHATNHQLSLALAARNLALAEKQAMPEVLAPCAACYNRLASARHALAKDTRAFEKTREVLERPEFSNSVRVKTSVEWLRDLAPVIQKKAEETASRSATSPSVTSPSVKGLKVACYYGCLLVRPPEVTQWPTQWDDPEDPSTMETVVRATGAEPVRWNKRLDCCGAGFSLSRLDSVARLGREILQDAKNSGAEALVVACPLCHVNLDFRQQAIARKAGAEFDLPVFYITELVGLALGASPAQLGLNRHYVRTDSVLERSP
ncbi:MAG TPA: CoB--CoM heterodisulfide reductase iron-sulfur subunit B family protein [Bdellovibrionota bacterium]|nr:CoB--CoM heterodisulfide reductase iron-sulfur subunit B family protein [Bdellovibrionota bacterium]